MSVNIFRPYIIIAAAVVLPVSCAVTHNVNSGFQQTSTTGLIYNLPPNYRRVPMNPDPILGGITYEIQSFSDSMNHIKLSVYSLIKLPGPEFLDAVSVVLIDAGAAVDTLPTQFSCAGTNALVTALSIAVDEFRLRVGLVVFNNYKYTFYIQILTDRQDIEDVATDICKYIRLNI